MVWSNVTVVFGQKCLCCNFVSIVVIRFFCAVGAVDVILCHCYTRFPLPLLCCSWSFGPIFPCQRFTWWLHKSILSNGWLKIVTWFDIALYGCLLWRSYIFFLVCFLSAC